MSNYIARYAGRTSDEIGKQIQFVTDCFKYANKDEPEIYDELLENIERITAIKNMTEEIKLAAMHKAYSYALSQIDKDDLRSFIESGIRKDWEMYAMRDDG